MSCIISHALHKMQSHAHTNTKLHLFSSDLLWHPQAKNSYRHVYKRNTLFWVKYMCLNNWRWSREFATISLPCWVPMQVGENCLGELFLSCCCRTAAGHRKPGLKGKPGPFKDAKLEQDVHKSIRTTVWYWHTQSSSHLEVSACLLCLAVLQRWVQIKCRHAVRSPELAQR